MQQKIAAFLTRLREILSENLALKVLSFAFALGLYAFIHGAEDAQRTFPVDVVAIPPPAAAHRVLLTPLPPLRVTVRGSRTLLDELRADDLGSLQLDLRSGKIEHLELDPEMVHVPPGVRAQQIDPPVVELRWEDEVTREVPIQAALTGQPAPGFVVKGAPTVEPTVVQVHGPRSAVEVIQFARAEAFDVGGLSKEGAYERMLAIDRPPPRVTFELGTATVKVELAREELQRLFVKVPVQVVGTSRATVLPAEVDVRIEGPPEIVRALRAEQIIPTLDLRPAGVNVSVAGSAKLPVSVELEHCRTTILPQLVVVRWQP